MENESGFLTDIDKTNFFPTDSPAVLVHSSARGYSELYRVMRGGKYVLIKALREEQRQSEFFRTILRKEFEIGSNLNHPGIRRVISFQENEDFGPHIEMEWIEGMNLRELAANQTLNKATARKILIELCYALEYIHQKQTVHRDLKPENILITTNGSNVKLIDFGLSDTDEYYIHKEPAGTKSYASPEQLSGEVTDWRSDIYSLGIIISEIAGKWYSYVADACLKQDKSKRLQSASAVRKAIDKRRRNSIISSVAAFLIILFSISIGLYFHERHNRMIDNSFDEITREIINAQGE